MLLSLPGLGVLCLTDVVHPGTYHCMYSASMMSFWAAPVPVAVSFPPPDGLFSGQRKKSATKQRSFEFALGYATIHTQGSLVVLVFV